MRSLLPALAALALLLPSQARAQGLGDQELDLWMAYVFDLEGRVARRSDDAELMLRLADAYVRIGDLRRAMPAIERLDDLGVDPVRLALLRGDAHLGVQDWDEAARAYLEALSHAPSQPHALTQLWRLMLQVTLEDAQVSFDRLAVVERLQREGLYFPDDYTPEPDGPDRSSRLVGRAASVLARRPEEAAALCIQAIAADPGNAEAFATLARAYQGENDPELAVGASLVYLLLAPDAPDADEVRRAIGRAIERESLR